MNEIRKRSTGGTIETGATETQGEKSVSLPLVHHKSHTNWPGIESAISH